MPAAHAMRPVVAIEMISRRTSTLLDQGSAIPFPKQSACDRCCSPQAPRNTDVCSCSPLHRVRKCQGFRLTWVGVGSAHASLRPPSVRDLYGSDGKDSILALTTCFNAHSPIACPLQQMPHVPRWRLWRNQRPSNGADYERGPEQDDAYARQAPNFRSVS